MIRVILHKTIQTGPNDWTKEYKTVDIEVPEIEDLIRVERNSEFWYVEGIEVLRGGQKKNGE